MATTTYRGFSTGAKEANHANGALGGRSAVPVLPATAKRSSGKPEKAPAAVPLDGTVARPCATAAKSPAGMRAARDTFGWIMRTGLPLAGLVTARATCGW